MEKNAFPFLRMCKAVEALIFFYFYFLNFVLLFFFYTKVLALKKTFASKADNVAVCKCFFFPFLLLSLLPMYIIICSILKYNIMMRKKSYSVNDLKNCCAVFKTTPNNLPRFKKKQNIKIY